MMAEMNSKGKKQDNAEDTKRKDTVRAEESPDKHSTENQDKEKLAADKERLAAERKVEKERVAAEKAEQKKRAAAEKARRKEAKRLRKLQKSLKLDDKEAIRLLRVAGIGIGFHELVRDDQNLVVDYRIREVNPAFETLVGKNADEIVSQSGEQVYGRGRPPHLNLIKTVMETGETDFFEVTIKGSGIRVRFTIQPVKGDVFALLLEDSTAEGKARRRRSFLETRVKNLSTELNEKNSIIASSKKLSAELTGQVKDLQKELGQLESRLQTTTSERDKAQKTADTLDSNLRDTRAKLKATEAEKAESAGQQSALQKQLAAVTRERDKAREKGKATDAELDDTRASLAAAEAKLAERSSHIGTLEKRLAATGKALSDLALVVDKE
jgi:PAS domain-containing protein